MCGTRVVLDVIVPSATGITAERWRKDATVSQLIGLQITACFVRGTCKAVCMSMLLAFTGEQAVDLRLKRSQWTCPPSLAASSLPGQQSTLHRLVLTSNGQT